MLRRVLQTIGIAFLGLAASPWSARAGTFDVSTCDLAGGVNATWSPELTHGGVAIYQRCPSDGHEDAGLVTRASGQQPGWTVPTGAATRWVFRAPPGAAVVGIRADARFHQSGGRWQAVLSNGSQVLLGCPARADGGSCGDGITRNNYVALPASPVIYTETFCAIGPCPVSWQPYFQGNVWARFILYGATVTVADESRPAVGGPGGSAWSNIWVGGRPSVTFDSSDNVGIREVRVALDERVVRGASRDCDPAALRCPDWPSATLDVPTFEVSDGRRKLSLVAVDRAGNVESISRMILIDNTPPAAPINAKVVDGPGWRSANSFAVRWENPPQAGSAPIAAVHYEMCPSAGSGRCASGSRTASGVTQLDRLSVPAAGEWLLRTWLGDSAGNARRETAGPPVRLGYDPQPPRVSILPTDPDDPSRIRLAAADEISGIARAEVEIRRRGRSAWRSLQVSPSENGFIAPLDDARLPDGRYDLRARVFDAAGNERSTDRLANGDVASIRLPVRAKTRMRVGQPRRVTARRSRGRKRRTRTIYISRPTTDIGRRVRIRGRLTTPGGNPLEGVQIDVSARPEEAGAQFQPVSTLTTSRTGRFTYLVPAGANRSVRFHYAGAPKIRPQTGKVDIRVRAASYMRASRRNVVNGEAVTFRGRLQGGFVPSTGKLVELQFFARGSWRTFATTRSDGAGRWRYEYRFDGTRGTVRWRFRARIPREAGYPFTLGTSRRVRITVRGA